jgi:hypothetical protein
MFNGLPSLNQFDEEFMISLAKGELTLDQTIALRIIKMSVKEYLFFGLGKNGITPERFLEAYSYLFTDPQSLHKELKPKLFNTHYENSGLSQNMPIIQFLKLLKDKRERIVNDNLEKITTYMAHYRAQEWKKIPSSLQKGQYDFPRDNIVSTLTNPEDHKAFARLYLFGRDPSCYLKINNTIKGITYIRLLF